MAFHAQMLRQVCRSSLIGGGPEQNNLLKRALDIRLPEPIDSLGPAFHRRQGNALPMRHAASLPTVQDHLVRLQLQQRHVACLRLRHQRPPQRETVHLHGHQLQAGLREHALQWVELTLPTGHHQHLDLPDILHARAMHLEIQGKVLHRKGKQLLGLREQGSFDGMAGQPGRQAANLADDLRCRQRQGGPALRSSTPGMGLPQTRDQAPI